MHNKRTRLISKAFTLIELLIVVAIIAILAAIAVPNFLEAQTRAKVSRARNDLRCVATGLESYMVDYNKYPPNMIVGNYSLVYIPNVLTTPISFVTEGCLYDVFRVAGKDSGTNPPSFASSFDDWQRFNSRLIFWNTQQWWEAIVVNGQNWIDTETGLAMRPRPVDVDGGWYVASYGPDLIYGPELQGRTGYNITILYDPTNGTVSAGDLVRNQRESEGGSSGRAQQ